MHECEKWKWSRSVVSDPQQPLGLQPSSLLHPWDFVASTSYFTSKLMGFFLTFILSFDVPILLGCWHSHSETQTYFLITPCLSQKPSSLVWLFNALMTLLNLRQLICFKFLECFFPPTPPFLSTFKRWPAPPGMNMGVKIVPDTQTQEVTCLALQRCLSE